MCVCQVDWIFKGTIPVPPAVVESDDSHCISHEEFGTAGTAGGGIRIRVTELYKNRLASRLPLCN